MNTLLLPRLLGAQIEAWACEDYPRESCGLLVGRRDGGQGCVVRVARARNLAEDRAHDRYELDPRDFLDTDRAARRDGLTVIGVWHSHPDNPARPSATDRQTAWPEWSYLIVQVRRNGSGEMASWFLHSGDGPFEEERIIVS